MSELDHQDEHKRKKEGLMQYKFTFILLLLWTTGAYSQQISNPLFDQGSEVLIDRLPENEFYYTHIFQQGQTVYSLAKTFKASVSQIYSMNNLTAKSSINIGQTVKVPFSLNALYTEKSSSVLSINKFVPVYYVAQPKETLYRIGKIYFGQEVSTFSKRNKINGTAIYKGQKLLIGWLPIDDQGVVVQFNSTIVIADEAKKVEILTKTINNKRPIREKFTTTIVTSELITESGNKVTVSNPKEIKEVIATASEELSDSLAIKLELSPTTRKRHSRGIGIWERDSHTMEKAFVLHHTAKKGSIIELYNPQLNLRTRAKVLGRIPLETYPSDISVIMSKKVANSLGALDTRFMVELTFIEDIK